MGKDKLDAALESIRKSAEQTGGSQQDGRMPVVAATMRNTGPGRSIGNGIFFFHWKCIHIRTQGNTFFCLPGRQRGDNAVTTYAGAHIESEMR
jgi:hypothetical protein